MADFARILPAGLIAANFLSRYGERIYRHYTKQAKRHVNPDKPWLNSNELF